MPVNGSYVGTFEEHGRTMIGIFTTPHEPFFTNQATTGPKGPGDQMGPGDQLLVYLAMMSFWIGPRDDPLGQFLLDP